MTTATIAATVTAVLWGLTGWRDRRAWIRDRRLALYADMVASVLADLHWLCHYAKPCRTMQIRRPDEPDPVLPDGFEHERSVVAARARILAPPRVLDEFEFVTSSADWALGHYRRSWGAREDEKAEWIEHTERAVVDLEAAVAHELAKGAWYRLRSRVPGLESKPKLSPPPEALPGWSRKWREEEEREHQVRRRQWGERNKPYDAAAVIAAFRAEDEQDEREVAAALDQSDGRQEPGPSPSKDDGRAS